MYPQGGNSQSEGSTKESEKKRKRKERSEAGKKGREMAVGQATSNAVAN